jgi:hypothetical protein
MTIWRKQGSRVSSQFKVLSCHHHGTMGRPPAGARSNVSTRSGGTSTPSVAGSTPSVAASAEGYVGAKRGPKLGSGKGRNRSVGRAGFGRCGVGAKTRALQASGSGRNSSPWTTPGVSHAGLRSLATGNPFGMSLLSQLAAVEGAGNLFKMLGNVLSAGDTTGYARA